MGLNIYNTLTRKKEIFKSIKKNEVGIYSCGPTVYWYQHIGNLRTYIFSDILKRVLTYDGFKVNHIINITDVGHLVSDADSGEDKMEKAAKKEGKDASEIAKFYFNAFEKDLKKLNILEPSKWTKATDHIKEQINLIKNLEEKDYTYKTSDGIYFDTSKLKDYGKLAKLDIKGLQAGMRINLGEKKNKTDFALWKFSSPEDKRQQEWDSPWGVGFPGWHIECSAMSMKYLGENFDVHTGGIDHIPVHHTNEIAQSESATGKKFVNYWMHGNFLTSKGEKISKSKGGLYTISELEKLGFSAMDYRYFCLTAHYRKPLNFTMQNLQNAKNSYERLRNAIPEIIDDKEINKKYLSEFEKEINDDLNMPNALQVLWRLLRDEKATGKLRTIKKMEEVFGLDLTKRKQGVVEIKPKEMWETKVIIDKFKNIVENAKKKNRSPEFKKALILSKLRDSARVKKNYKEADRLRIEIEKLGIKIEDTSKGTKLTDIKK